MKKILSLILVLSLSLALMLGCSGTPNTPDTPDEEVSLTVDPDIEAEISILVPSGNDNEKTMINCLLDDFSMMFPNVTVSMRYVSITNYDSSIRQMAAAGTLPDIIWSNSPDFYYLVNKNLAMNLNGYIEASEAAGVFDLDETFYSEFFDCGSMNGNLYCIPRSSDRVVTFYNKEMFEAAGVDMTKVVDGWTWDDFLDACAKLRTYFDGQGWTDRYIVDANLTGWLSVCYPMLLSYGGEAIDQNGNVVIESALCGEEGAQGQDRPGFLPVDHGQQYAQDRQRHCRLCNQQQVPVQGPVLAVPQSDPFQGRPAGDGAQRPEPGLDPQGPLRL